MKKMQETTTGDVVPVLIPGRALMARRSRERRTKEDQREGINDSMFSAMLGENIIPDQATEYAPIEDKTAAEISSEPVTAGKAEFPIYPGEPLINPSVALVAPDVTPDALVQIDPSEVPQSPITSPGATAVTLDPIANPIANSMPGGPPAKNNSVIHTLLGLNKAQAAVPESQAPTIITSLPGFEIPPTVSMTESGVAVTGGYNILAAAMAPGLPMPEPTVNPESGKKVMEALRKFGPKMKTLV